MKQQQISIDSKQLSVVFKPSFMFAFFCRMRARINKHYSFTSHELYYIMFADYYCKEHLYFNVPALVKFNYFSRRCAYPITKTLCERGFIAEYLPPKLNNCSIAHNIDVSKRKRRKTGRLYIITPKGKQVMTYLMRCYNDIHKEIK